VLKFELEGTGLCYVYVCRVHRVHKECRLILVTRFNGSQLYVNAELIQTVEGTPDTVITLTTGVQLIVHEAPQVILDRIMTYRRQIHMPLPPASGDR
jgi:flagellar protein FlbD